VVPEIDARVVLERLPVADADFGLSRKLEIERGLDRPLLEVPVVVPQHAGLEFWAQAEQGAAGRKPHVACLMFGLEEIDARDVAEVSLEIRAARQETALVIEGAPFS